MATLDYVVLISYFALMAGIGFVCMRRVKAQDDYFLGGRGFGRLLQTFAAFGAGTGSADPVNTGRTTFTSGLSGMWSVMYWLFVTPFYWITAVWYRRMRHTTLGDWFTERYESRLLGAAYALFGLFFMVTYGSMMFSAIGKVAAPLIGAPDAVDVQGIEYTLVPIIGLIVLIYGTAGGLSAAYWTDLIQGLCILLLSVLLIPFGLAALVEKFGDPTTMGLLDGFGILHQQAPAEYFSVVGASGKSEFPLHFLVVVVLINLITVVVQPHFILTGGGTAKTEDHARVGLVVGNLLKRFCTLGWVLTAMIALALFADSAELAADPDKTWGVASRELLGPGLRGLMLACLLAALMSSIDVYMIVGSALVVRNVYVAFLNPEASERQCLRIARFTGIFIVGGSVAISLFMMDVFAQLKLSWITLAPIAATFWVGMYWRRATTGAAWTTIAVCGAVFFVLPWLAPALYPNLRTHPALTAMTPIVEVTSSRPAAPTDVARRQAEIRLWDERAQRSDEQPAEPRPEPIAVGDFVKQTKVSGGAPVFWTESIRPIDVDGNEVTDVAPTAVGDPVEDEAGTKRVERRYAADTLLRASGNFRGDFLIYKAIGLDLGEYSASTLSTLDYPPKIVLPFLMMIVVSLITPKNSTAALDRYYVKMKTPVRRDPQEDAAELADSYDNPRRFDDCKIWPRSAWEFQRPTTKDIFGFTLTLAACFGIIFLAIWMTSVGS